MEEIKKILIADENFPELLKKIPHPPSALYYKGKIKNNELCFAIVGTRLCTPYGKQVAIKFSEELSDAGLTIVSGLAPGIDTCSHLAAVEKNKRTVAVLGTGIDEKSLYPKENIRLSRKIVETGGCLISEYPPGTPGSQFSFPQRNRIISGLSHGVLVVEAKEKSGSLITANYAFLQKRKVFSVPGPIFSPNSKGANYLIKQGAKLVDKTEDILQELNLPFRQESFAEKIIGQNKEDSLILKSLAEGPLHIDKIIENTKLKAPIVAGAISILEIEGRIRNLGGDIYSLK